MDPAAFALLLDRCAPGAPAEPLTAIVRLASAFESLLITIEGKKPIPLEASSLEEGVHLASEAAVAGQTVRIGLAQLGPEDRKQTGLTISASFDPCKNVAALHSLYQARFEAVRAKIPDAERATASAIASFVGKGSHAGSETATRSPQTPPPAAEPAVERAAVSLPPAEQRSTLDVYRSGRGASLFVYER